MSTMNEDRMLAWAIFAAEAYRNHGLSESMQAAADSMLVMYDKRFHPEIEPRLPEDSPHLLLPVVSLEPSVRLHNILKDANIRTIGELVKWSPSRLKQLRQCGPNTVREIKRKLKDIGLSLKPEPSVIITECDESSAEVSKATVAEEAR